MSEWDFEYGGVSCPECGDEAPLSPISGLCYDCENAEDDDEEEEVCIECGDTTRGSFSDAGSEIDEDGLCPECREALGSEEE